MARHRDEQKKELIIKSATKLFAEKGFHATSIQDIVSESGLSVGTIYLYFANKEEIFDSLLDTGLEVFVDELLENASKAETMDEIAEMFVSTIIDVIHDNIDIVTVLTNELSFQEKLQDFYSKIAKVISKKYLRSGDAESLYKMLQMTRKEFFALVTILISGISNAMRLSGVSSASGLMNIKDIRVVIQEIILGGLMMRVRETFEES